MEKEIRRFEAPEKPILEDLKEVIPNCSDFDEPEKAEALIKNLGLIIGDTIKENGEDYIINPRMVLRGTTPKAYEKEIKYFKELCTPLMLEQMDSQIKKKKKFGDKQRDKFYNSFCKRLDNRLKVKSLKESEAVKYFTQEDSFKNCVAGGLHNCVYHLLDIEKDLNEFKLAWFNTTIPNTQTWNKENDGEYMVLTDSEADSRAEDYFDDDYMWKQAVESGGTTLGQEEWEKWVIDMDGRGSLLNGYNGCEEYEDVNGTTYYIYRTN